MSAAGGGEAGEAEAAMPISWLIRIESGEDTTWYIDEVEKRFNVDIIPNGVSTQDREKLNVLIAAGDFPEAGGPQLKPAIRYYNDGVIRAIPKDMIRTYAPNYTKLLDSNPQGWLLDPNPDNENEGLGIQGTAENVDFLLSIIAFRHDWAEKVGMGLPNWDSKKIPLDRFGRVFYYDADLTLEWFEDLLIAFRDNDPDGNGKDDTIPFSAAAGKGMWETIMGAFGIGVDGGSNHAINRLVDGELYHWSIDPRYKDFLRLAARWYEEGLIDRDFADPGVDAWGKIAAGQVAAGNTLIAWVGAPWAMTRPPNIFATDEEVAQGAEVAIIAPPVGPTGIQGAPAHVETGPMGNYTFWIGDQVGDEKAQKILEIIDFMRYGEDEEFVYSSWGKPGVHFEWEGEPWKSKPLPIGFESVDSNYSKVGGFGTTYPTVYTASRFKFINTEDLGAFYDSVWIRGGNGIGKTLATRTYKYDVANVTGYTDLNKLYGDTLGIIEDTFYFDVIMGRVDLDSAWDAYVSEWRTNGGNEILAELEKAPIISEFLSGRLVY
jgi:hypothetical protein